MKRSSIATQIILFSLLTVLVQFSAYFFLGSTLLVYGIAALLALLFSHVFLEQTLSYESCFNYSLLNIFLCVIIILLSFFGNSDYFVIYDSYLLLFIALNWFIPTLYCIIRNLMDRNPKYMDFNVFYHNISVLFIFFYVAFLIFTLFFQNKASVLYYTDFRSINFVPFLTLATLIEDYLSGYTALKTIILYLVQGIIPFMPYGFYATLLLRYQSRLFRFIVLLILPVLVEILQRVFLLGMVDIDDVFLAVTGGFIGAICYHILNSVYRFVTDEDFLFERTHYSFPHNSLHF